MGFKGYSSSRKVDGSEVAFATMEPIRTEQHGISVLAHSFVRSVINDAAEAGSTAGLIVATSHVAKKGDVINVLTGPFAGYESKVVRTDTNSIFLADDITLVATNTFEILRHKYPVVAADGGIGVSVNPTPIIYTLDGNDQEVTHDTVVKANTKPLPIHVFDADNDLIDPATNSAVVDVEAAVQDLNTDFSATDFATEVTLDALLTAFNAEDFATETTLDALLTAFNAEDFATQTTLDALLTAFNAEDFASETTLDALLTAFNAEDFATQAKQDDIITALNDLFSELQQKTEPTDTQPVSAVSLPLPTGAATDTLQTTGNTSLNNIDGKLPTTIGQKAMAASLAVVLASDQSPIEVNHVGGGYADSAVKNSGSVTSGAWVQLIASTAALAQGLTVFDSSGESLEIGIGAAASETRVLVVPPGGLNGFIPLSIPAGTRISIRAISTTADYTDAVHILNLIG